MVAFVESVDAQQHCVEELPDPRRADELWGTRNRP